MANPKHLSILQQGVEVWNQWRKDNSNIVPDLSDEPLSHAISAEVNLIDANLRRADLREANLDGANLHGAYLYEANLFKADLTGANLSQAELTRANVSKAYLNGANLRGAELSDANLSNAVLSGADLTGAYLTGADLTGAGLEHAKLNQADLSAANFTQTDLSEADLRAADLNRAILVDTYCNRANFSGCRIYGISAWNVQLTEAQQTNLIVTRSGEPDITVDNLEVAQFIYLLLHNQRIRHVIDTITSKVVLILGRFTPERKQVLEAIRESLRSRDYLPVLFDFDKPTNRDITETVSTLAHMARFIIADITDAKSIPQELTSIVPSLPSVPVQPLLLASQHEYGMFEHFKRYPWVLETVLYQDQGTLLRSLQSTVILPAEQKANELVASQRK